MEIGLTGEMIEAAAEIYGQLRDWQATDRALSMMRERLPGFSFEEILLKVNAVNTLYATNVYAVWKAAKHVEKVLCACGLENIDVEQVELMAKVPNTKRRFVSFASKFAHFFVDEERFPILDSYAEASVKRHLGPSNLHRSEERRYFAFVTNLKKLKECAGYAGSNRNLDRYLWLAGQYRAWLDKEESAEVGAELKEYFRDSANGDLLRLAFESY